MSSSKIFKDDPSFTPVSLISHLEEKFEEDPDTVGENETGPETPPAAPEESSPIPDNAERENEPPPPLPDLEAVRSEAYQQGQRDAEQGLVVNLSRTLETFSQACAGIDTLHNNFLEQSRSEMINIIIAICEKIIGQELATGRDIIADSLSKALELAIRHNEYDVTVHPDDLASAEKIIPELVNSIQSLEHINLKTDPRITRGGCRLDSEVCMVDATIEAQLETAREFLDDRGVDCAPQSPDTLDRHNITEDP